MSDNVISNRSTPAPSVDFHRDALAACFALTKQLVTERDQAIAKRDQSLSDYQCAISRQCRLTSRYDELRKSSIAMSAALSVVIIMLAILLVLK